MPNVTVQARIAAGLCSECGGELDRPDRRYCAGCREQRKLDWEDRKIAARDDKACMRCGGPAKVGADGRVRTRCQDCTDDAAKRQREIRAAKKPPTPTTDQGEQP